MKKFELSAKQVGKEWAGTYTVEVIYAPDSISMYSELDELIEKQERQKKNPDFAELATGQVFHKKRWQTATRQDST